VTDGSFGGRYDEGHFGVCAEAHGLVADEIVEVQEGS
jgi:hypothetical protein